MSSHIFSSPLAPSAARIHEDSHEDFVFDAIFGDSSPLIKSALEEHGMHNMIDFMLFTQEDFAEMEITIQDPKTQTKRKSKFNKIQQRKLGAIQGWFRSQPTQDMEQWYNISELGLNAFIASRNSSVPTSTPNPMTPMSGVTLGGLSTASTQLQDFHKSIKRSVSDYSKLKDDRHFSN